MYVGTSPEFELALNTISFYARPNAKCPVSLNGSRVQIQTYDITNNGKKYVASAYPDLS
jgi:poly(U)-specific endoribonuclease